MSRPNVFAPEFDDARDRVGYTYRDAWIGRQAGAERLGASLYELDPGQANAPYHWHAGNEEMLIVLRGTPSLRTADGWRELSEGDVVAFPRGRRGVHQVANRSDETVRCLIVSEMHMPEVVVYPDSNKVGARSPNDDIRLNFVADDAVDYWHGEQGE